MATKGRGGASSVANYVAEAQARRQKFADGGVPPRSLLGRVRDNMSRSIGDKVDSLRANTVFESATARGVREMGANNGLGVNAVNRDNFSNGMDGVQTREKQLEELEKKNLPPPPPPPPPPEKPASEIQFSTGTAYVNGPGTGTSDSIPARLSKGEAVLPAKTVQTLGVDTVADLIEATNGKKPKTIGESVRGKFADGGVPDPKKLGGVQAVNGPAYKLPKNPTANLNTDLTKGGVTSVSEAPLPKTPDGIERPAYQRAHAAGDARAAATINMLDTAAKGVGSGSAAAGGAATQAAGTAATQAAGTAAQPVANAVDATKTAAKGLGSTVKGWWSKGVDAGKQGLAIAKSGIEAGKEVVKPAKDMLSPKAGLYGGLIAGGLSAYDDLTSGKTVGATLGKAATRAAFGGGGALVGSVAGPIGSVVAGGVADHFGDIAANYYFGDPNDGLKNHAVTKFLEDGKNMARTSAIPTAQRQAPVQPTTPSQTVAAATPSQTAAPTTPSQQKSLGSTVQGVSPVNISEGVNRYDLGGGQSPLYTNLGAAENESFLNARKQALNSDPGWQPPRQQDLPYVDDSTPAGQAENDLRDQARIANEQSDYRNQGLAQRAAENKRSMQNQYAYEQIPEGVSDRVRGIMAYRDNQARELAQNASHAQQAQNAANALAQSEANAPRDMLLNQIQSKLASGGQLTKAGLAAIQGVMGDNTHRYSTDAAAASSRYNADSSAASSRFSTEAGMFAAKMSDATQRRGQDISTDHNRATNEIAKQKFRYDRQQQEMSRTAEGNKQFNELLKTSKHAFGVDKDGVAAVDAQKLAEYSTWLRTQSAGVDGDGRPQSLSAKMMGMNPDEVASAMASADNAYTVRNVFKRNAEKNGWHHTSIGDGVPDFTVDDMTLADPLSNQAGWLSSARSKLDPRVSGKVIRMKNAQGGTIAVPMSSLSAEEQSAFIAHQQLQAKQRSMEQLQ